MKIEELAVPGVYRVTPSMIPDERGVFYEAFRLPELVGAAGHPFRVAQANFSVSRRNTLRGVHGVTLPPGQAKYVTCVSGAVQDIVVDLRVGSPTFGQSCSNELTAGNGVALYIPVGLGHAFLALTDDTRMNYLCSTVYEPGTPFEVNPLDPELALPWELAGPPVMSPKDRTAPTLAEAVAKGMLASYEQCVALPVQP
ncbi:MAG TPA: dTDP-4-dehydrorhamnose 3,5-epimerase family protein [Streptosporangiaceae bacterium]|nr:dTDP-4-dehydrorhamnose 3,5-epimerase family protein [Streptosporangiaceae bacterium]